MILKVKIKSRKFTSTSKENLMYLIGGYANCFGSYGTYSTSGGRFVARVFNIEKINKKTKQIKVKNTNSIPITKIDNEKVLIKPNFITKSTIIRKKQWIAYVYDFPLELLAATKIKVVQNGKTFKIVNS
jgi:hypothetical protein